MTHADLQASGSEIPNKAGGERMLQAAAKDGRPSQKFRLTLTLRQKRPGVSDILTGAEFAGAVAWIKSYCRDHPTAVVHRAAVKLIEHMRKNGSNP